MRRLLFLLSCCVAVTPSFHAADAPQEKPLPVTKEPYHKTVFENDALRIIDVQIPPGQTCKYHVHVIPSAVIYLTKSTNKSQPWGETDPKKFLDRTLNPGESRYAPYDTQPLTHRVTNTGIGPFRVFDIELLHSKPATAPTFAKLPPQAVPQWEDKLARMSKVALAPGAKCEVGADGHARLLVGITGGFVAASDANNAKPMKWADYRFFAAQTPIHLVNPGTETAEALLLELN
jgi:hypothetical protein